MDRLIAEFRGRIANTAGDSVLAEFPSVVDAVQCAVAVQERLTDANSGVAEDRAVSFRIGIHVGDVMIRGADLLGDGVNIAARVEQFADPGGVCISGKAYDEVEGKLPFAFRDRGEQQLKGIARPLRVFAVSARAAAIDGEAGGITSTATAKPLSLPDKPSIAVLPFENMSGDPEQEYFADGVVEDLITALSRIRSFFVIARNSSFTYKGKAVDIRQVGRELGVRYVLEGSIRKAGHRVRITGQLIEAATGRHIWADKFDGALEDIFELQDRITESVVSAIEPTLTASEIDIATAKSSESLSAYDLYLRALPETYRLDREAYQRAEELLRQAVELDPKSADALAALTFVKSRFILNGWASLEDVKAEVLELARRAIHADPDHGVALANASWAYAALDVMKRRWLWRSEHFGRIRTPPWFGDSAVGSSSIAPSSTGLSHSSRQACG
jgi:adenylate cyclase